MIDLYLSKNRQRNQLLLDFFQNYGIEVSCHSVSEMTKDKLIEMMSYSSDCFEFLSPNLLRFKNRDNLRLTDFVEIILKNPELTIRLPLAVSNKRFFSSVAHSFERIVDGSWMTAKFRSYFSQISIWIVSKIVFKSISINFSWFCSFYLVV
ncbi:arsenate reductase-like glutaredoxin family protein [Streptococcus pneumoniae]|nr:arsenate reductase-like glutaredoxin family protein [Streptococcus pneumoniae]